MGADVEYRKETTDDDALILLLHQHRRRRHRRHHLRHLWGVASTMGRRPYTSTLPL